MSTALARATSATPAAEADILPSPFWARRYSAVQHCWAYRLWLGRQKPLKVALLPTDPWPGDAGHGADLADGLLRVGAQHLAFDETVLAGDGDSLPAAVHEFGWIRDLHALGGTQARIVTRKLIAAWLTRHGQRMDATWDPHTCGQRLANWLMHYSFYGSSASDEFCDTLHASMIRQMHVLRHRFAALTQDRARLSVLYGLAFATGCLRGMGGSFEAVLLQLDRELSHQLDADGAHRSASPAQHIGILRDLVAIRGLCHIRQREIPAALREAMTRMAGVVRFLRLGDGSLPLFHGTPLLSRQWIDQTLSLTGTPAGTACDTGPDTAAMGLHKLTRGPVTVMMDGVQPHAATRGHYHASPLAFEMTVGRHRLITGCGWFAGADKVWRDALRSTPAHTALTLNGMSSATFEDDLFPTQRLSEVTVTPAAVAPRQGLVGVHNGYVAPFGVRHRRTLHLLDEHGQLAGEDVLEGQPGQDAVIRFHLAPHIRAVVEASKRKAYLDLPTRDIWALQADSGTISLEPSLYFDDNGERIATSQIVLTGTTDSPTSVFKWLIGRV
jgi:uncharacterized heparinase superfamily protein